MLNNVPAKGKQLDMTILFSSHLVSNRERDFQDLGKIKALTWCLNKKRMHSVFTIGLNSAAFGHSRFGNISGYSKCVFVMAL